MDPFNTGIPGLIHPAPPARCQGQALAVLWITVCARSMWAGSKLLNAPSYLLVHSFNRKRTSSPLPGFLNLILWVLHTKCCSGNPLTWDWLTGKGTAGWPAHTKPLFLPQFPMPWSHPNPERLIVDHLPQAPQGQGGVNTESAQQWNEFCTAGCYSVQLNKDE